MEEKDIKIGQRIVLTKEAEKLYYAYKRSDFKAGMRGKIIYIKDILTSRVLIEFDDFINGHDGAGRGKNGHCWWLYKEDLTQIAKVYKRKNNY